MGEEELLIEREVLLEGEVFLKGELVLERVVVLEGGFVEVVVLLEGEVDLKEKLLLGHPMHPKKILQREKIMLKGILHPLLLGHPIGLCLVISKNAMHLRLSGINV